MFTTRLFYIVLTVPWFTKNVLAVSASDQLANSTSSQSNNTENTTPPSKASAVTCNVENPNMIPESVSVIQDDDFQEADSMEIDLSTDLMKEFGGSSLPEIKTEKEIVNEAATICWVEISTSEEIEGIITKTYQEYAVVVESGPEIISKLKELQEEGTCHVTKDTLGGCGYVKTCTFESVESIGKIKKMQTKLFKCSVGTQYVKHYMLWPDLKRKRVEIKILPQQRSGSEDRSKGHGFGGKMRADLESGMVTENDAEQTSTYTVENTVYEISSNVNTTTTDKYFTDQIVAETRRDYILGATKEDSQTRDFTTPTISETYKEENKDITTGESQTGRLKSTKDSTQTEEYTTLATSVIPEEKVKDTTNEDSQTERSSSSAEKNNPRVTLTKDKAKTGAQALKGDPVNDTDVESYVDLPAASTEYIAQTEKPHTSDDASTINAVLESDEVTSETDETTEYDYIEVSHEQDNSKKETKSAKKKQGNQKFNKAKPKNQPKLNRKNKINDETKTKQKTNCDTVDNDNEGYMDEESTKEPDLSEPNIMSSSNDLEREDTDDLNIEIFINTPNQPSIIRISKTKNINYSNKTANFKINLKQHNVDVSSPMMHALLTNNTPIQSSGNLNITEGRNTTSDNTSLNKEIPSNGKAIPSSNWYIWGLDGNNPANERPIYGDPYKSQIVDKPVYNQLSAMDNIKPHAIAKVPYSNWKITGLTYYVGPPYGTIQFVPGQPQKTLLRVPYPSRIHPATPSFLTKPSRLPVQPMRRPDLYPNAYSHYDYVVQ